jgi:hypothetical protein
LLAGFLSVLVISLVAVGSLSLAYVYAYKTLIGPTLLMLGLLSMVPLRLGQDDQVMLG